MTIRLAFFVVLACDLLAVGGAMILYKYSGVNHFRESGFITVLSVAQLLLISGLSYQVYRVRRASEVGSAWRRPSIVWLIIAAGFVFLAADEYFRIHENLDHQIHRLFELPETGLTDRIDDMIVGVYGLVGLGVLFVYRDELKVLGDYRYLITGFVLLFVMVVFDMLSNRVDILQLLFDYDYAVTIRIRLAFAEDALKIFAEGFFILAFFSLLQNAKHMDVRSNVTV